MTKSTWALSLTLVLVACAQPVPKEYLKDSQSMDAPSDASKVITLPEIPKAGRKFEVRRTYETNRSDRQNRKTPPGGYIETLKPVPGG